MSQSLRSMQAVVAEALEAMKRTGEEKAANQALEAHLRSTRQRLEEAGREKAAMAQSLRAMQAAVAEALENTKRSGDEKAANQALEADLRSMRQQLEKAGRDKAAASQSQREMLAAVADREGKLKIALDQASILTTSLAAAKHDAMAASEATKRAGDGRVAIQALEADLRSTRQRLEEAGHDQASASQSQRALQTAVADREGKLKAAEAQAAVLTASLAAAKHDAVVASETTKRFGGEKAAAQAATRALEADLRSTHQQLEETGRDKAAASQSMRAMQAAAADRENKLRAADAQATVLAASLAAAKNDAAVASDATKRTGDQRAATQALEAELRSTRQRLEEAGRDKAAASQSMRVMQAAIADRESKLRAAEAQTPPPAADLASAKHDALMASEAMKRTGDEKAATQALEADLRSTRRRLEEADRDKAAISQSLDAIRAVVADRDGKLKAAETQTSALTASLASAKRDALVALESTKRSGDEKAANQALEAELRSTRQRLDEAGRDKVAISQSLHAMQAAIANREGRLKVAEAQTSVLTASLATAKHDATAATEATIRTGDEKAANQALARQRREEADRDKAAAFQSLRAIQAAVADREGKLKAAEARGAVLTASLAAAKHDAATASEATKQIADEKAANRRLEADLRLTRQRLEDAGRDKAAISQTLRAMQSAVEDREGKLKAAEAQAAILAAGLATAKHDAATSNAMDRTAIREEAEKSFGSSQKADDTPSSTASTSEPSSPSNVVLQYRAGNPTARQKATALISLLSSSGIFSKDVSEVSNVSPGVHVMYYYKQDKMLAKQVSKSVTSSEPTQKRAARDQMPLPGTIEVSVGG